MKLIIVTTAEEFKSEVLKLFKNAQIENLSTSPIGGYKNKANLLSASNWFTGLDSGTKSCMFFSFTDDEHIDILFRLVEEFNSTLETNNPVKAVVVPIERFI